MSPWSTITGTSMTSTTSTTTTAMKVRNPIRIRTGTTGSNTPTHMWPICIIGTAISPLKYKGLSSLGRGSASSESADKSRGMRTAEDELWINSAVEPENILQGSYKIPCSRPRPRRLTQVLAAEEDRWARPDLNRQRRDYERGWGGLRQGGQRWPNMALEQARKFWLRSPR